MQEHIFVRIPEQARLLHLVTILSCRIANHSAGFWKSCPRAEPPKLCSTSINHSAPALLVNFQILLSGAWRWGEGFRTQPHSSPSLLCLSLAINSSNNRFSQQESTDIICLTRFDKNPSPHPGRCTCLSFDHLHNYIQSAFILIQCPATFTDVRIPARVEWLWSNHLHALLHLFHWFRSFVHNHATLANLLARPYSTIYVMTREKRHHYT